MTSRSLRNPRTTACPISRARTGVSLAILVCFATGVVAADPPPQWERPANIPPAQTVPPVIPPVVAPTPAPRYNPPDSMPPVAVPTPGRTVAFQKPPGSETPTSTPVNTVPDIPPLKPIPIPPGLGTPPPAPASAPPGYAERTPISRDRLFRLESDLELRNRIVRELIEEDKIKAKKESKPESPLTYFEPPIVLPNAPGQTYQVKSIREAYPPVKTHVEPDFVVHRRLYFEEKNAERYGWDMGILQPVVSTAMFYKDVLLWPANLASHSFERYDTSAGKYLAGSPVPYFLYPPEIDLFGFGVGGVVIAGVAVILP